MKINTLRVVRVGFGLLALSAIATEIIVTMNEDTFNFFNFFGFFTVLSNLMAGTLLLYLGLSLNTSKRVQSIRGAVTLYMLMTGVIFAILLANLQGVRLTAVPWDNIVLHYIMPIVIVADWFAVPPKNAIRLKTMLLWLVFPAVYVAYSLIRGNYVGWYPYPFLNPNLSSYAQVIVICLFITLFVITIAFIIRRRSIRIN